MSTTGTAGRRVIVAVAAELLGVDESTIRRWCRGGRFPGAIQPGRAWQIPMDAVRALLTSSYTEGGAT